MASALLKEISDDFLTCQICLEAFRRPKILDCLHSFCEKCLKEYVKPGETEVKCPTCQRGTALKQDGGVSGLKDNFFILNLVETIGARKKVQHSVDRVPCDSCGGTEAVVSRCLTCNDFLCESCVAIHQTLRAFKGHLVVSLDELRTGKYDGQTEKQEPTCDTHAGEKMRFYCKTDGVPVCRDCIILDHPKPEHNVVNLAEITDELRSSCQYMVTELQQALGSTEDAVKTVDKSIEDIQAKGKKAEQLVDEQVSHLVTFIKKLGEQCKEKVEATCRQEEKQQYAEKERLELKKVRLSSTQELLQTLLSRGTDIEVASAFSQIRQCRDELCTGQGSSVNQVQSKTTTEAGGSRTLLEGTEEWNTLLALSGTATLASQPSNVANITSRGRVTGTAALSAPNRQPLGATEDGEMEGRVLTVAQGDITQSRLQVSQPRRRRSKAVSSAARRKTPTVQGGTGEGLTSDGGDTTGDCPICLLEVTDPISLPCKHTFCRDCIDAALSYRSQCPVCHTIVGELKGNQPQGSMTWEIYLRTRLPGYEHTQSGAIVISYYFSDGIQGPEHPNPGRPYKGTSRRAYLPNNDEGRELVQLLKRAFDNRLVFTIGTSVTTGATDTVIWNDIPHKTNTFGGAALYGYPDPGYLARLRQELAAKGIK